VIARHGHCQLCGVPFERAVDWGALVKPPMGNWVCEVCYQAWRARRKFIARCPCCWKVTGERDFPHASVSCPDMVREMRREMDIERQEASA